MKLSQLSILCICLVFRAKKLGYQFMTKITIFNYGLQNISMLSYQQISFNISQIWQKNYISLE